MIDIKDKSGNVLFTGNAKDAEHFLRTKKKIDKEFRDNEIKDWGCAMMLTFIFFFILFILFIIF